MESIIEHVVEAPVAQPPPRRARLPLSTNLLLLAALLLFVAFIYGGSRALLEALKLAWLAGAGRTVPARITMVQTEPSASQGKPNRQTGLHYVYTDPFDAPPRLRPGSARLNARQAAETQAPFGRSEAAPAAPVFRVGDTLPLRCGTWFGQRLVYPWPTAPTGKIAFLVLCGAGVVGISGVLLSRLARWRGHRLRLLRFGIATVGTVLHKDARAEDAPRYFVRYGYAAGATPREHEEQVSIEQWKRLHIGQPVTVLYDPDHVEDAGLYALLGKG